MGSLSIWHWIIVGAVFLLLFGGGGKISGMMGDFAKGIKAFKKGLKEDEAETPNAAAKTIDNAATGSMAKDKDHATTV